jgi:hypothetical protein
MGEGIFDSWCPDVNPRPLAGEGGVKVLCPLSVFSKEHTKLQERNCSHREGTEYAEIFLNSSLRALSASAVNRPKSSSFEHNVP